MVFFSDSARSDAANAVTIDGVRAHDGVPGSSGTDNALGPGIVAASFGAAAAGVRTLDAPVEFTGLGASANVSHFSLWDDTTFVGWAERTSGDATANVAGEYTLTTDTTFRVRNPS